MPLYATEKEKYAFTTRPSPPRFLLPPAILLGIITPLGGSQTKAGLLQKGPLQRHSFPYPREYGGRGSKRLPPKASHIRPWLLGYQGLPEEERLRGRY